MDKILNQNDSMKQKDREFLSVIHLVILSSSHALGLIYPILLTAQLCGICLELIVVHRFLKYNIFGGKNFYVC